MAGASKTARRSSPSKPGQFQASAELTRIVPLANGDWAYLRSPLNGTTKHVTVAGDDIVTELVSWGPDWAAKVTRELAELSGTAETWDQLAVRYTEAMAAAAEQGDAEAA